MVQDEVGAITKYLLYKSGIKMDRVFQGHKFENTKPTLGQESETMSEDQKRRVLVL